jgi:hypothetical protein
MTTPFSEKHKRSPTKACALCVHDQRPVSQEPCFKCLSRTGKPYYEERKH